MKRITFLTLLGLFTFTTLNAQFSIGLTGGLSFPNVKYDLNLEGFEGLDTKNAQYYYFGIVPKYAINEKWSINTDLLYSLKGYMLEDNGQFGVTKFQFAYFDILPKVEYQIIEFLSIGAGVNIGFRVDEKAKFGDDNWMSTKDLETISSTDFGLVGVVRGSFKNFFVVVAYNYGLTNIGNINFTDVNGQPIDSSIMNRNLQIGVGYFFQFDKK